MCHAKYYINMSIFKCVNTKTTFAVNIRITCALKYENIKCVNINKITSDVDMIIFKCVKFKKQNVV